MEEYIVYKYDKAVDNCSGIWQFQDTICEVVRNVSLDKDLLYKKILFSVATKGRQQIVCIRNDKGEIIHYSFVIPYCKKFSFMNKKDVCIGPCWTREDWRGKGIYGKVLDYIAAYVLNKNPEADLFVLIREANISSNKGIRKANYVPVGTIRKTKILKHYKNMETVTSNRGCGGENKVKRVITYGTFDLLHYGHINLLQRAKELGDYLVVALSTDEFNRIKGKKSYFTYEERKKMLEAIRYVDLIIPEENWEQKTDDVKQYCIDVFVMGNDWSGKFDFLKEEGVEVVYLERTPDISTTQIKEELATD